MKDTYYNAQTNDYFKVQAIDKMLSSANFAKPHEWFTIFIIEKAFGELIIDDFKLSIEKPCVVFITPGQHFQISKINACEGSAISFNKEFYCIEYHDADVSCNGLLFVNNFTSVQIMIDEQQYTIYRNTVIEMVNELQSNDPLKAEMLKNLLKNLLIRSNRLFRTQNVIDETDDANIDFARKFSSLVEKNFKEIKQVEAYADMMGIAAASLTKKLQKYGIDSPSRIIKNRVITEAKRLLMYTDKSVKEIASIIGYDDPHYFSRLFTKESGISPSDYKKNLIKS